MTAFVSAHAASDNPICAHLCGARLDRGPALLLVDQRVVVSTALPP